MFVKTQSGKLVNLAKYSQIMAIAYTSDRNLFRIEVRGHSIDYVPLAEGLTKDEADRMLEGIARSVCAFTLEEVPA